MAVMGLPLRGAGLLFRGDPLRNCGTVSLRVACQQSASGDTDVGVVEAGYRQRPPRGGVVERVPQ